MKKVANVKTVQQPEKPEVRPGGDKQYKRGQKVLMTSNVNSEKNLIQEF